MCVCVYDPLASVCGGRPAARVRVVLVPCIQRLGQHVNYVQSLAVSLLPVQLNGNTPAVCFVSLAKYRTS